jgi:heme-degrading monooxygenase HmoA
MVLELALLDVIPGMEREFERSFATAKGIIASMPGFESLELQRCLETPTRYALLVRWQRLKDHTEGFRKSPQYERWRELLHRFYSPFPRVEHYHGTDV